MSVTLDSLVGQGPALTYCGLKGQHRRSSIKRQFHHLRRRSLILLGAKSKNQALVPAFEILVYFISLKIKMPANGSDIFGSGKESLMFKIHC